MNKQILKLQKIQVNHKQHSKYKYIINNIMIKPIATLKSTSYNRIWSIDWHPKQNLLASVGQDKKITMWKQSATGQWLKTQSIQTQHLKTIRCIKFSHSGNKIAVCSFDSLISIYILSQSCYQFLCQLQGHQSEVKCIDWHSNDMKIASCSRDKNIWIWEFNQETFTYQCQNILEGHQNDVKCVKWIDHNTLASCAYDDTIRIWEYNDDDYEQTQLISTHQSIVWSIDFKDNYLISSSSDLSVTIFKRDEQSLKFTICHQISNLHDQPIYCSLIFYPYFLTGSGDNRLKLSKIQDDKHVEIQTVFHANDVNCIRCKKLQNGYLMASCSDNAEIQIAYFHI